MTTAKYLPRFNWSSVTPIESLSELSSGGGVRDTKTYIKKQNKNRSWVGEKKKVQHANIEEITNSSFAFAFSSSYTTDMQKLNPT